RIATARFSFEAVRYCAPSTSMVPRDVLLATLLLARQFQPLLALDQFSATHGKCAANESALTGNCFAAKPFSLISSETPTKWLCVSVFPLILVHCSQVR